MAFDLVTSPQPCPVCLCVCVSGQGVSVKCSGYKDEEDIVSALLEL